MLEGSVEHSDSMGNAGSINAGDIQWMTAGSGIIHQEMPKPVNGGMGGFQLWVNLPRAYKMMNPRYQEIKSDQMPVLFPKSGITIRIISGLVNGVTGPVRDIVADPEFLDVTLEPDMFYTHPVKMGYTAMAYVIGGAGTFDPEEGHLVANRDIVLFSNGPSIWIRSFEKGMRFLFFSGKPIGEPVAWRGPDRNEYT